VGREVGREIEVIQTVYTHVSKCKNNAIKEGRDNKIAYLMGS
jgi:hypothetical protein